VVAVDAVLAANAVERVETRGAMVMGRKVSGSSKAAIIPDLVSSQIYNDLHHGSLESSTASRFSWRWPAESAWCGHW